MPELNKLPWAYFDTSVYLKIYVKEKGSEEAKKLAAKSRILSSAILPVECLSAISRKREEGFLNDLDLSKAVNHIREGVKYAEIVNITDDVLKKAEAITLNHGGRDMDAVHIASALVFEELTGVKLTFATSDRKQLLAADRTGLKTIFVV